MPYPAPRFWFVLGYALVTLGTLAIGGGAVWKQVVPATVFWSDQQQRRYDAAYQAAHTASFTPAANEGETSRARQALAAIERELANARSARDHGGRWLMLLGAILAGGGVLILRRNTAPPPSTSRRR